MKDLDFDEIDRAVNSVITSTPTNDENTETDSNNLNNEQTENSEQKVNNIPSTPAVPLARRRSSGQFMDVVHPSSDMRRLPLMMPKRASESVINSGSNDNTKNEPQSFTIPEPNVEDHGSADSSVQPSNTWPDPIDFSNSKNGITPDNSLTKTNENNDDEDDDINRISDDIHKELNPQAEAPLDSPFISGTKVEKRPLGTFSNESSVQSMEQPEKNEASDKPYETNKEDNTEYSDDSNIKPSLPAELQDDLLKIESNESVVNQEIPKVDEEPVEQPLETKLEETKSVETQSTETQPSNQSSIPQQYKEQPSTGDQNSGAIYDTNSYHKALAYPMKKKSGWILVLWISIIIILGAGAGAAIFILKVL